MSKAPVRLYVKGAFVGYKRSHANQYERQALISLDGKFFFYFLLFFYPILLNLI